MQAGSGRTIGIAWYRREDYREIRSVMEDAHILPSDYETWLRRAQVVVRLEEAKGSDVVKATVHPALFATWCHESAIRPDANARARHVNLAVEDFCSVGRNYSASVIPIGTNATVTRTAHAVAAPDIPMSDGTDGD